MSIHQTIRNRLRAEGFKTPHIVTFVRACASVSGFALVGSVLTADWQDALITTGQTAILLLLASEIRGRRSAEHELQDKLRRSGGGT